MALKCTFNARGFMRNKLLVNWYNWLQKTHFACE